MGRVSIKKTVSFDFLGKEYEKSYIVFKAIPVSEYSQYIEKIASLEESSAIDFVLDILTGKFLSGSFLGEDGKQFDLTAEDLKDFDGESITTMFATLTGQQLEKKD